MAKVKPLQIKWTRKCTFYFDIYAARFVSDKTIPRDLYICVFIKRQEKIALKNVENNEKNKMYKNKNNITTLLYRYDVKKIHNTEVRSFRGSVKPCGLCNKAKIKTCTDGERGQESKS